MHAGHLYVRDTLDYRYWSRMVNIDQLINLNFSDGTHDFPVEFPKWKIPIGFWHL